MGFSVPHIPSLRGRSFPSSTSAFQQNYFGWKWKRKSFCFQGTATSSSPTSFGLRLSLFWTHLPLLWRSSSRYKISPLIWYCSLTNMFMVLNNKLCRQEFIMVSLFWFQATIELCQTHANDVNALKVLFSSLTLISKLFYSLNFQVSFVSLLWPLS